MFLFIFYFYIYFSPTTLCCGYPFLPSLSRLVVIAGFPLFRPPVPAEPALLLLLLTPGLLTPSFIFFDILGQVHFICAPHNTQHTTHNTQHTTHTTHHIFIILSIFCLFCAFNISSALKHRLNTLHFIFYNCFSNFKYMLIDLRILNFNRAP